MSTVPIDPVDIQTIPEAESTPIRAPGEKKDFKTQANYNLRELEAENNTLGNYKMKIVHQMNVLQIEEHIMRKSIENLENREYTFEQAQEMISKLKSNLLSQ
jgi:molybdopterin synthase catalytic subunit